MYQPNLQDKQKVKPLLKEPEYNIFSGKTKAEMRGGPPEQQKKVEYVKRDRDFDLVSNVYYSKNTEKAEVEKEVSKLQAAKKFWKKNDYNLVEVKFYDKEKERRFQQETDRKMAQRVASKDKNLPSMYKT